MKPSRLLLASAFLIAPGFPVHADEMANIKLFQFMPKDMTVKVGSTITWTNGDDIDHSVTAGEPGKETGAFDSDFFKKGGTYAFKFEKPGTYEYFCKRHNSMKGKITVTP